MPDDHVKKTKWLISETETATQRLHDLLVMAAIHIGADNNELADMADVVEVVSQEALAKLRAKLLN
jgi:hypothetical protein